MLAFEEVVEVCGGQWLRLWAQTDLGGSRHVLTPWERDAGDNSQALPGPRDVPTGRAGAVPGGLRQLGGPCGDRPLCCVSGSPRRPR